MVKLSELSMYVDIAKFMMAASKASTKTDIDNLLRQLPVVSEDEYLYDAENPGHLWQEGKFHWIPVGRDRGNAGRIKLAHQPINPIAERVINGFEAIIELCRQRELKINSAIESPRNPRDSVKRYFGIPALDQIPKMEQKARTELSQITREIAKKLRVRLIRNKDTADFTISIEDEGIGQSPDKVHATLLSLGSTSKGDKPYLIGVFGQGGSSAYSACEYSWVMSSKAPDLLDGETPGVGWSVIKHVFPKGRRDDYFAYLAAHPDGRVPNCDENVAKKLGINHGTRFVHVNYDFGGFKSQVVRTLYPALNHVLFNPVLPYELYAASAEADLMSGNSYRLSRLFLRRQQQPVFDKTYSHQVITAQR
ncbi:MAG: hypothetical protein LLF76_06820 [Planctomycetaceae bacterium]|nr:hypothetical protein [Planctomycetaceae bacterium]